jgi:hypothetical protein
MNLPSCSTSKSYRHGSSGQVMVQPRSANQVAAKSDPALRSDAGSTSAANRDA